MALAAKCFGWGTVVVGSVGGKRDGILSVMAAIVARRTGEGETTGGWSLGDRRGVEGVSGDTTL